MRLIVITVSVGPLAAPAFAQSGRTVLISSHLLAEVEQTIDQVVIISRGQTDNATITGVTHPSSANERSSTSPCDR